MASIKQHRQFSPVYHRGRGGGGGANTDSYALNKTCTKCNVKLIKHRPNLYCEICSTVKHHVCQGLSKNEARYILENTVNGWICRDCIVDILPVNACTSTRPFKTPSTPSFRAKCQCCNGMSYNQKNIKTCPWCDKICCKKYINFSLGCNICCEQMIPGFRVNCYELIGNFYCKNSAIFNPYSSHNHINHVGDQILREEENNALWNEISESLLNCDYKQPKNIQSAKHNEPNIFSLNIRSLHKNLTTICDNVSDYQKYDILCFNETNCNPDKLANGLDDLMIEGFHSPIVQSPVRNSDRGGGLPDWPSMLTRKSVLMKIFKQLT